MSRKWLVIVALALVACPPLVIAQDAGAPDTVILVAAVTPDFTTGQDQVQIDIYTFNDETLSGISMGFEWDNFKAQMDSAVAYPPLSASGNIGPFFYENADIVQTNANQRFLLGWSYLFGPQLGPVAARARWVSYYFTVTDWQACDTIRFDTLTFNAGSAWVFAPLGGTAFQPLFEGGIIVVDTACAPVADSLVVSESLLEFTAEQGGSNPADQSFAISSTGNPLDFSLNNTEAWLSINPASGTTEDTISVSVDITGLGVGLYADTITVTSAGAANSPELVAVALEITPPLNQPPVLDSIGPQETTEMVQLQFSVTASDPDGPVPVLSTSPLPGTALFTDNGDGTGLFDWTPTFDDSGTYEITFYAADSVDPALVDSELVMITVIDSNRVPFVFYIPAQERDVNEGDTLRFLVQGIDPDSTIPFLSARLDSEDTLATNMVFVDSMNGVGVLTFLPDYTQGDEDPTFYFVRFRATDEFDPTLSSETPTVLFRVFNVNRPPEIAAIDDFSVCIGDTAETQFSATDFDGDPLSLWIPSLEPNMTFTDNGDGTGDFVFAPEPAQMGSYPLTMYATDGADTSSENFTVSVIDCSGMDSARAEIVPDFMYIAVVNAVNDVFDTVYVGDFIGGHTAGEINTGTILINGAVAPESTNLLPGYGDFTGEVLQVIINASDFVEWYGPVYDTFQTTFTVTGELNDLVDFAAVGDVTIRGHKAGDINLDGKVNNNDLVFLIDALFRGGAQPVPERLGDINGDCDVTVADVTHLVNYIYKGGPKPANANCVP